MDDNPVNQLQRMANDIIAVLMFAKDYLGIKSDSFLWDWETKPQDKAIDWAGFYDPRTRRIFFNGYPSWDTILHEAVHYKQHERGDDLVGGYARFTTETKTRLAGLSDNEIAWQAYWGCPWEVEARTKAYEMAIIYRNRRAGLGAHYA